MVNRSLATVFPTNLWAIAHSIRVTAADVKFDAIDRHDIRTAASSADACVTSPVMKIGARTRAIQGGRRAGTMTAPRQQRRRLSREQNRAETDRHHAGAASAWHPARAVG